MRRTGFKPSTVTLKSNGFVRTDRKEAAAVAKLRKAAPARKAAMKVKHPKMTPIRASARGEQCTLRFACCNFDPATTVWCHSNRAADGKGMGIKARDHEGAYGCSACHAWLDGGYAGHMRRETVDIFFDLARANSQTILRAKGLMPQKQGSSTERLHSPGAAYQNNPLGTL
jgi:hypothetical protein